MRNLRWVGVVTHTQILIYQNSPVNEDTPRWDKYRLSKSIMQSIQDDSNQFRITCRYETDGVVYIDYLRATRERFDIMKSYPSYALRCKFVEYINIGGQNCSKCTVVIHQGPLHVHGVASSNPDTTKCEFKAISSPQCERRGETYFGWYDCYGSENRCTSSPTATTQTWLGNN